MKNTNAGYLQRLVRWIFRHRHEWVKSNKISLNKQTIYTVRKCAKCGAHEVQDKYGNWSDVKTCKYSSVPAWEEYHRKNFETAIDVKQVEDGGNDDRI